MSGQRLAPVMVVSGSVEFLRVRSVQKIVQTAKMQGRRVVNVAAGDELALRELVSSGFLFSDATVAVVESAQQRKRAAAKSKKKADGDAGGTGGWSEEALEMVLEHAKEDGDSLVVVVHHEGEAGPTTFAGQVAAGIRPNQHFSFPAPKPWKEKDFAVSYLTKELKRRGKSVSEDLADLVVQKVGTDVGLLHFEALKIATALDVDGRTEATAPDVAPLLAAFGAEDWEALKLALANRNAKAVVRAWNDIRNGPGGDAIQKAVAILSSTVVKWVHAAALHEAGMSPEDAASRMGIHSFRYSESLLPAAVRWGRRPLEELLKSVVDIGVRKGHINPWVAMESVLVQGCLGVR